MVMKLSLNGVPQDSRLELAQELGIDSVAGTVDLYNITGLTLKPTTKCTSPIVVLGGSLSPWIGPVSFITACLPQSMPYYESLDSWPVACWDSTQGNADWVKYTGTATPGDNYAVADFWSNSTGVYYFTSPPVTISQDAQLRFFWSHLVQCFLPG